MQQNRFVERSQRTWLKSTLGEDMMMTNVINVSLRRICSTYWLGFLKFYRSLRQGGIDELIIAEIIDKSVKTALEAGKIGNRLEAVRKDLSLIVIQLLDPRDLKSGAARSRGPTV